MNFAPEMVSGYGAKFIWYEMVSGYGAKFIWYEMISGYGTKLQFCGMKW
jgi:hypothetical protein